MAYNNNTAGRPPGRGAARLKALLVPLILIGAIVGYNVSRDDDSSSASSPLPSSSSSSTAPDGKSGEWKTGDCGGPDPEGSGDSYQAFDCDDPGATFKALEIMDAAILPDSIQCPAGTDIIIQVSSPSAPPTAASRTAPSADATCPPTTPVTRAPAAASW